MRTAIAVFHPADPELERDAYWSVLRFARDPGVALHWLAKSATHNTAGFAITPESTTQGTKVFMSSAATFERHLGRPMHPSCIAWLKNQEETKLAERTLMRLTHAERSQLAALGKGNMTEGLREALRILRKLLP